MLSADLVKCGKCQFSFHNHNQMDTCPNCGNQLLNPSHIIQGSSNESKETITTTIKMSRKQIRDLDRILEFTKI
jgi:hypothetical protein